MFSWLISTQLIKGWTQLEDFLNFAAPVSVRQQVSCLPCLWAPIRVYLAATMNQSSWLVSGLFWVLERILSTSVTVAWYCHYVLVFARALWSLKCAFAPGMWKCRSFLVDILAAAVTYSSVIRSFVKLSVERVCVCVRVVGKCSGHSVFHCC